jgi:hypothetical protein
MNLLYKTGKDIPAEPAMIQYLAKAGLWDERPFVRMIQERQFALVTTVSGEIALSRERYSPAVAAAIEKAYEPVSRIGDYTIYRPTAAVIAYDKLNGLYDEVAEPVRGRRQLSRSTNRRSVDRRSVADYPGERSRPHTRWQSRNSTRPHPRRPTAIPIFQASGICVALVAAAAPVDLVAARADLPRVGLLPMGHLPAGLRLHLRPMALLPWRCSKTSARGSKKACRCWPGPRIW